MMMNHEILFWLIFLNVISIMIAAFSFFKIAPGKIRSSLILLVLANLLWYNSVYLFRFQNSDEMTAVYISRLVFVFAYLMFLAFSFFLYRFSEENVRSAGMIASAAAGIIMMAGSLFGFVEDGVRLSGEGYRPVYGYLHPYYLASIAISGTYLFYKVGMKYRKITSELLKFQFQFIFISALLAFSGILITNGIIPEITGRSNYSHLGPFFSLLFFGGVAYVLANGPVLAVRKSFNLLLKEAVLASENNIQNIREFVGLLQFIITDKPDKFQRKLRLRNSDADTELYIGTENNIQPVSENPASIPYNWTKGLMDSLLSLESDNKKMFFSLIRAERMFHEKWLGDTVSDLTPSRIREMEIDNYKIDEFRKILDDNSAEYGKLFGNGIICFSPQLQKIFSSAIDYAKSTQMISVAGDPGSGRSVLARAIHHNRNGGVLTEISCLSDSIEFIKEKISAFINAPMDSRPEGLLFRYLDAIPPEKLVMLEPVLKDFRGQKYVYITISNKFYLNEPGINKEIFYHLMQLSLKTVPLCERSDDIFYQIFWNIIKYSSPDASQFQYVSKKVIKRALEYPWPGNNIELENVIRKALMDSRGPVLETISFHKVPELIESRGHLSPLEESEQNVIFNQLQKNNFNKNKTSRDLKISINTLNTKMKQYGITIPGKS